MKRRSLGEVLEEGNLFEGALLQGEEIHWDSPKADSTPMTPIRASGRSIWTRFLKALSKGRSC